MNVVLILAIAKTTTTWVNQQVSPKKEAVHPAENVHLTRVLSIDTL